MITKFVTHNWPAKVLSLCAALLVWFVVNANEARVGTFPGGIPLVVENVPEGLVAITDVSEVQVSLVAERVLWQRLTAKEFTASITVTGLAEGVVDVPVIVTSLLPGVEITRVEPARVLVRLESVVEKSVPVTVRIDGSAADGFAPGEPTVTPSEVTLRGPESQLVGVDSIVAFVSLTGEREELSTTVPLLARSAGEELTQVRVEPAEATVRLPITRAGNIKSLGVSAATQGVPVSGYVISRVQVAPSVVAVTGSASTLAALTHLETESIDLTDIRQTTEVKARLVIPEGVKLLDDVAGEVMVTILVTEVETARSVVVSVGVTPPSGRRVRAIAPQTVSVHLEGPASLLADLRPADLAIQLPITEDTGTGTQTRPLTPDLVAVPESVRVISISPSTIEVTLE